MNEEKKQRLNWGGGTGSWRRNKKYVAWIVKACSGESRIIERFRKLRREDRETALDISWGNLDCWKRFICMVTVEVENKRGRWIPNDIRWHSGMQYEEMNWDCNRYKSRRRDVTVAQDSHFKLAAHDLFLQKLFNNYCIYFNKQMMNNKLLF